MKLEKFKKISALLIILINFSCTNENDKFDTIKKLSDVSIPDKSSIIIYNDNLEIELAFKIKINKKEVSNFLKLNNFKPFVILEKNPLTMGNTNKLLIYNIENSFIPREKINGKNLKIFMNEKSTMVINCNTSELWGVIDYN